MAVDPNIALGVRPLEVANPLAQYTQLAQLQNYQNQNQAAQNQSQVAQMQIAKMQQNERYLANMREAIINNGGPADMEMAAKFMATHPSDPNAQAAGLQMLQAQQELKAFNSKYGPTARTVGATGGFGGGAPIPSGALGSGTYGITPPPMQAPAQAPMQAPVNALAPQTAPTANALLDTNALRQELFDLSQFPNVPQAKLRASIIQEQLKEASKLHVVPNVGLVSGAGATIVPSVETAPSEIKQYEYAKQQGYKGTLFEFKREMAAAGRAPATPSAPVAIIGPDGKETYVTREQAFGKTPASSGNLKQVPANINMAIIKNNQGVQQLSDTIKLLEQNPDATGFKGFVPGAILNRADPEGVNARAGVADIGSLVMHERSGAAVTASESPRLVPFIPLITDDNATALKKLKRMKKILEGEQQGLVETYSKEQGYKENPIRGKAGEETSVTPQMPPMYANNGKERIMSTDGGQTWTPAK
jgi:hypothetical protein